MPDSGPPRSPGRALGLALRDFALAELGEAERLFASTGEALHHGIHFGRKALRRCRAALALAAETLGERGRRLDGRLRRLLRSLSRERDAQAVLEALEAEAAAGRIPAELAAALAPALRVRRDRVLARRLERDPGLARLRTRLRRVTGALAALPWAATGLAELKRALARQRRRALRAAEHAREGTEEERHRLRRRLRRLRQQLRIARELAGRSFARYAIRPDPADELSRERDRLLLVRAIRSTRGIAAPLRRAALAALGAASPGQGD